MNTNITQPSGPECARYTPLMPQMRHDTLESSVARSLHAHLEHCPFCQAQLAAYDRLDAKLRSYAHGFAPAAPAPDTIIQAALAASNTIRASDALRVQRERMSPRKTLWPSDSPGTTSPVPREVRPMRFTRQHPALATTAAILVIVIAIGLFATISHLRPAPANPGIHPTPISTIPPTATSLPTTRAITALQAWGANAATRILDTKIDATHTFRASSISPDGKMLLGYRTLIQPADGAQAQSGYFDIATRHFTAIGIAQPALTPPNCCQTDGRYLLATLDTSPGATCGLCHRIYYSYDMDTGQLWQIAKGGDYGMVQRLAIDHGIVMLSTGQGIYQANLAAHTVTPVQLPGGDSSSAVVESFTWPYLVYTVASATHAYDLATRADVALPQFDKLHAGGVTTGDTLFLTQTTNIDATHAATILFEDDAFFSSSAAPRALATYADQLAASAANTRLVAFYGGPLVWDRVEQRFVTFGTQGQQNDGVSLALSGHFLAVIQTNDPLGGGMPQHVTIYDTDTLPSAPTA